MVKDTCKYFRVITVDIKAHGCKSIHNMRIDNMYYRNVWLEVEHKLMYL